MEIIGNLFSAVAFLVNTVLKLYFWVIIVAALLSWVRPDPYNPIVRFLRAVTDPVFYRVRRWLPFLVIGGIDLTPIVVLLAVEFLRMFLVPTLYGFGAPVRM
ncbi:MAG: YggT family protein [Desulfovibrionaceae bacterium]